MPRFLILKLDGPMQAWGIHTYEDFRPSNLFPTRSGLLGLLGACLGIDRNDFTALNDLADSVEFTVRLDHAVNRPELDEREIEKVSIRLADYHTVIEARRANRLPKNGETIQTSREYLFDAAFTVAVGERDGAVVTLDIIASAVKHPVYTPSLGRRSCPLSRPLLCPSPWQEAENAVEALENVPLKGGRVYTEDSKLTNTRCIQIRDIPVYDRCRSFEKRMIYIYSSNKEAENVS